jgi:hypothetical protein
MSFEESIEKKLEYLEAVKVTEKWSEGSILYTEYKFKEAEDSIKGFFRFVHLKEGRIQERWHPVLLEWCKRLLEQKERINNELWFHFGVVME